MVCITKDLSMKSCNTNNSFNDSDIFCFVFQDAALFNVQFDICTIVVFIALCSKDVRARNAKAFCFFKFLRQNRHSCKTFASKCSANSIAFLLNECNHFNRMNVFEVTSIHFTNAFDSTQDT